jgi:large subunit ribosomal protein L13
MKTYSPVPAHIERRWYVIDASEQVLGRLASEAAALLRGKHKPIFAPHMDVGDHVIIINADKAVLTGGKEMKKIAYRHSGYPGGIKGVRYDTLMATRPVAAVEKAVKGMLPKNRLGRAMGKKLHVVAGDVHPHAAQRPEPFALGSVAAWDGLPTAAPVEHKTKKVAPKPKAEPATQAAEPTPDPAAPPAAETTADETTSEE